MTVVAAKISVSIAGQSGNILGISSESYRDSSRNLIGGHWWPVLDIDSVTFSITPSLPYDDSQPTTSFGQLRIRNASSGSLRDLVDKFIESDLAGQPVTVKRGDASDAFGDMELVYEAEIDRVQVNEEELTIGLRSKLSKTRRAINSKVFDDGTSNEALIGQTVPNVFGEVRQVAPKFISGPALALFAADNMSRIIDVFEGAAVTQAWTPLAISTGDSRIDILAGEDGNTKGFQLESSPTLPITCDLIGPLANFVDETSVLDWTFDDWTADDPDDASVFEGTARPSLKTPAGARLTLR